MVRTRMENSNPDRPDSFTFRGLEQSGAVSRTSCLYALPGTQASCAEEDIFKKKFNYEI
jgi:hypothetical protein